MALTLSGCSEGFKLSSLGSGENIRQLMLPSGGEEDIIPLPSGGEEIIIHEAEPEKCYVRARHFQGMVQRSCAAVASETRG